MGRLNHDQGQFFYSFRLDEAVPNDHPIRGIAGVLDLSWVYSELAPFYPKMGRPSIDPVLMIRMLVIGYAFAIRSERALCREVRVNLAYRWFCGLSIEDKIPDHSAFSRARHEQFRESDMFRRVFERVLLRSQATPFADRTAKIQRTDAKSRHLKPHRAQRGLTVRTGKDLVSNDQQTPTLWRRLFHAKAHLELDRL